MAIINILKNAENISLGHSLSLVQTKSDSGVRKAQRRGPYLYNFEVEVSLMTDISEEYYNIRNEISKSFQYGVNSVSTQMPVVEVKNRGSWAGSPKVFGSNQSGTSVTLDGFTANVTNIVRFEDWVQFPGGSKVYQILSDANSNSLGQVTVTLNTPLIESPDDNAVLVIGNNVEFNLALVNPDSVDPTKTPAKATHSIARFGTFIFEEVL